MSRLTGLLILDLFTSTPEARIDSRQYYDLNELNYRRLQALVGANPELNPLLENCLVIERNSETICLVPMDVVKAIQSQMNTGKESDSENE